MMAISREEKAYWALIMLRDGMRANDDQLDDRANDGRDAQSPTGDDYNVLFDLVQDALAAVGIPYREAV